MNLETDAAVRVRTDRIAVDIDVSRGAEVLSAVDLRSGVNVLMRTPWASEARKRRPVRPTSDARTSEPVWTASYAGGWQTLVPHAGDPEEVDGAVRHYHGEASIVPWTVDEVTDGAVTAHIRLDTVPMRIDRTIAVDGDTVRVADVLTNQSDHALAYDYQSHPAFGAPFLDSTCRIGLAAAAYVSDPRFELGEVPAGVPVTWPLAESDSGSVDLSAVPDPGSGVFRFGWLEAVRDRRVTIVNPRLGLEATLEWDEALRDRAWLWLDAGARADPPWDGQAYALAIEPSTRATVRDRPITRLEPGRSQAFSTRLTVRNTNP